METGKFAYRFSGSAMKMGMEFHLVGVGIMNMDADGKISGFHTASITPLNGSNAAISVSRYTLRGNYGPRKGGFGDDDLKAKITFTSEKKDKSGNPVQVLTGTFSMVPAGSGDRFWLISTGAYNETEQTTADEVVSGEAIKIT